MSIVIRKPTKVEREDYWLKADFIVEQKWYVQDGEKLKECDEGVIRLELYTKEERVYVEADYYSFDLSFDEFLQIADKIRELKKEEK